MRSRRIVAVGMLAAVWAGVASAALPSLDDVKAKLAAVGEADKYGDAKSVVVLDEYEAAVRADGLATTERCRVVKILKDDGARGQAVQSFDFDPTTNVIDITAARVHRKGGTVEEVDVAQAVTQPAPQGIIFWGSQQRVLSIPRLAAGDAVEIRTSKTGFNVAYLGDGATGGGPAGERSLTPPMPGHWYETVYFEEHAPIVEVRYTVRIPADKPLQYSVHHGTVASSMRIDGDHHVYTWEAHDVPAYTSEPKQVAFSDAACKLVLATLPDWQAKSRWFYESNEPSFAVDDAVRLQTAEVVAGLADGEAKIAALTHWVAENVRYVGTTRGPCEGYTTHPAIETFHDRGGVCKDKAGLLVAMLREAGFDSYIVMTQAGSDVERTPADQFNHAVTSIRHPDGSFRLLDATWAPKSRELWSSREQRQAVVYGTPDGVDMTLSPYSPPEDNYLTCTSVSELADSGALTTKLDAVMDGYPDTALRKRLAGMRPNDRPGSFDGPLMRLASNVQVSGLEFTEPTHFAAPTSVRLSAAADGYALGRNGVRFLKLPGLSMPLADLVASDLLEKPDIDPAKRTHDMRLGTTRSLVYTDTLKLPPGWTVAEKPDAVSIDNPVAGIEFTCDAKDGEIAYALKLTLKKHVIPAKEVGDYKAVNEALHNLLDEWVVLRTDGSASETVAQAAADGNAADGDTAQ